MSIVLKVEKVPKSVQRNRERPTDRRRHRSRMHAPAIHAASHVDHQKRVAWSSISMHAFVSLPIVMVLRLATLRPAAINPMVPKFCCFILILFKFMLSGFFRTR